jgi:hypothetical protein
MWQRLDLPKALLGRVLALLLHVVGEFRKLL